MSKSKKILLGVLTALPIVFFILYFVFFIRFFSSMMAGGGQPILDAQAFSFQFFPMFIFMGIAALMSLGLLVYYLVHISKNPKFNDSKNSSSRVAWILVVIFAGIVGMIVYFFVEIWPSNPDTTQANILDSN